MQKTLKEQLSEHVNQSNTDYPEQTIDEIMQLIDTHIEAILQRIETEVIGSFDSHKAMKPQNIRLDQNNNISREWTDQDEDWKTIMTRDKLRSEQLAALRRLRVFNAKEGK